MTLNHTMPETVNGWHFYGDVESMLYYRETPDGYLLVDKIWLDTVPGDDGYDRGAEYVVCAGEYGYDNLDEAIDDFKDIGHTDGDCVSDLLTNEEADAFILDYLRNH